MLLGNRNMTLNSDVDGSETYLVVWICSVGSRDQNIGSLRLGPSRN